ncbi:MAG: phosphate signaling complex protein PhoU [Bacillota bacterium]
MEQIYEQKKNQLLDDLSDMSEIAEDMLQDAITALDEQDVDLAKKVINKDDVLDNYKITVEEEVSRLLSFDKPLISDARYNIALVNIATNLERIGDHATNIAETVLELKNEEYLEPLILIPEIADLVSDMLDAVLEAYITENADLAEAACRKDEHVDNLYSQLREKSIKLIDDQEKMRDINQIVEFLNVAKSLERIGDHATNIGEETIYIVTDRRVKY